MTKRICAAGQIEVDVSGHFTTHHYLRTKSEDLGEITFAAFAREATYRAPDGRELRMQKAHWLGSSYELVDGGVVRGKATQAGFFRQDLIIQLDGSQYSLEPEGCLSQGWQLFDVERNQLLEIRPRGMFRQGAYLTITVAADADLVVFAYYLYQIRQQESAAAGAASASAAATS
jgi:hypothetical protein